MVSIYDWYIMGGCVFALLGWCLCVWFDKDARPTKQSVNRKVFKSWKDIK
jgi:hypothetical protein